MNKNMNTLSVDSYLRSNKIRRPIIFQVYAFLLNFLQDCMATGHNGWIICHGTHSLDDRLNKFLFLNVHPVTADPNPLVVWSFRVGLEETNTEANYMDIQSPIMTITLHGTMILVWLANYCPPIIFQTIGLLFILNKQNLVWRRRIY